MQLNFQGIVIQKYDCGDTHLVIHVMSSNHGKLSILAKHARKSSKRFGTKIDLFDQGTFSISKQSNAMPSLTNFEALGCLKKLRSDMDKLILASVLAESVDTLVKEESQHDGPIYSALTLGLAAIDEASSLKDSLRAACLSLSHILAQAGISDMEKHSRPSIVSFLDLINQLEIYAEKKLKTKDSFLNVIEQFRRQHSKLA